MPKIRKRQPYEKSRISKFFFFFFASACSIKASLNLRFPDRDGNDQQTSCITASSCPTEVRFYDFYLYTSHGFSFQAALNRVDYREAHGTNMIINFVPQQEAWVVERMGKFYKTLDPVCF